MFDLKKGLRASTIIFMFLGLLGLTFTFFAEQIFVQSANPTIRSAFFIIEMIFLCIFIFTLLILLPLQVIFYRRKKLYNNIPTGSAKNLIGLKSDSPDAKQIPQSIALIACVILWLLAVTATTLILIYLVSNHIDLTKQHLL